MVTRFLAVAGLPSTSIEDPMHVHGGETGADVQVRIAERLVGVQVRNIARTRAPRIHGVA